jgi:type IV fimbrial biogenesis protein FimT
MGVVELVAAMAIVAILAGIGLPAFHGSLQHYRLATAMHEIGSHLAAARMAAISHGMPVSFCPADGDGGCRGDWEWTRGALLYLDPGRASTPASPAHVLRQTLRSPQGDLQILSSSGRRSVRFQPDGRSGGSNIRFRFCQGGRLVGEVVVNNTGRIRSARTAGTQPCG